MDAKKLAAALREAVRLRDDWRDALIEVAVQIEDQPAPVPDALIQAARERGPMSDAERQAQHDDLWEGHTFTVPSPAPIPADVRAVVREALEAVEAGYLNHFPQGPESVVVGLLPPLQAVWRKVRAALAALDAAPAEPETLGYGVISKNGKTLGRDAAYALAQSGDRIVRLVVEPSP